MNRSVRMASVLNGLTAGISGSLAAVIQQGVGNLSGGSALSVAAGGAAGAYIAVMIDVIRYWLAAHLPTRVTNLSPSFADEPKEGDQR